MNEQYKFGAPNHGGQVLTWRAHLLTVAWSTAGTVLYLLAPATAPVVLPLSLVWPLAWCWRTQGYHHIWDVAPANLTLAIAAGYAFINASWSPARVEANQFATMLLIVAVCAPIAVNTLLRLGHRGVTYAMAVGFYTGFAAVASFWCLEILTQAAAHNRLMPAIPALWPNSLRHVAHGGELPAFFLNQKMVGLAGLFWPAVLTATHLVSGRARRAILICALLPAVVAIAASEHQTSQAALLTSGVVYAAFKIAPWAAQKILLAAWATACLAVVPLCLATYAADLHKARWLPVSAQHRIVIWKATSDRVFDAPLLGHGIHASRAISRREPAQPLAPGTPFRLSVSWHSHNAFLQVWFEVGAVGAVILLIFGLVVIRSIRHGPQTVRAALFATFSSCAMLSATGYSAFAPWVSASFALAAIFASLAARVSSESWPRDLPPENAPVRD